jgi:hypothetical protein
MSQNGGKPKRRPFPRLIPLWVRLFWNVNEVNDL